LILLSELCQIYIIYFNEILGQIPLLIFPEDSIKVNEEKMRPVKFHPIWFLDGKDQNGFRHINLVYEGKVYFAKKFQNFSKKKKSMAGLKEGILELIVIIIVLPKKMDTYGLNFLNIISEKILIDFEDSVYQIIESAIQKENLIRTPKIREIIKKGDCEKDDIKNLIQDIWENYFLSISNYYEEY